MENLRYVTEFQSKDKSRVAKLYKDVEWEEIRVKFFVKGKHQKDADYHTDDITDAKQTAKKWIDAS